MSTPAWLSDGTNNDAGGGNFEMTSGVSEAMQPNAGAPAAPTGGESGVSSEATATDEEKLPKMILTMRLANMGAAIALIVCSILTAIGNIANPSIFILAIYATCGGLLICCLETQLKFLRVIIAINFGFLFNFFWRFLFYLLLASVTWSYNALFGQIISGVLVGVAVFNTYILCRYPSYRKMREKIAEEEDKRIEARISKEVKKQAIRQATK